MVPASNPFVLTMAAALVCADNPIVAIVLSRPGQHVDSVSLMDHSPCRFCQCTGNLPSTMAGSGMMIKGRNVRLLSLLAEKRRGGPATGWPCCAVYRKRVPAKVHREVSFVRPKFFMVKVAASTAGSSQYRSVVVHR